MPEYIPKANPPSGIMGEIMRMQSQQKRPEQALIEAIQGIGMSEMTGRQQYKEKKLAREQKVEDTMMDADLKASIQALNDYTEGKARLKSTEMGKDEKGKPIFQPSEMPTNLKDAWKSFEPDPEYVKSARGGSGTDLNEPANPYILNQIDGLNAGLVSIGAPESELIKAPRDGSMTKRDAYRALSTLTTAYELRSKQSTAIASVAPRKTDVEKSEVEAGRMGEAIGQKKPPKTSYEDTFIFKLKSMYIPGTKINAIEAIKTKDEAWGVRAVQKFFDKELTPEQAKMVVKKIKGI
jgi:hypothetical protein